MQAQAFLDDAAALRQMAEMCSEAFENARENERKFGGKESEERYSKRNNSSKREYDFGLDRDLSTLDNNELEVYNKRGWAYGLLTEEDYLLLQNYLTELKKGISKKADNVLRDKSRVFEVNNKILIVDSNFENPSIVVVLAIDGIDQFDYELLREDVFNVIEKPAQYDSAACVEIFRIEQ